MSHAFSFLDLDKSDNTHSVVNSGKTDNFTPSRSLGVLHRQNLGFSRVSRVSRVRVRRRLRFSFSGVKL